LNGRRVGRGHGNALEFSEYREYRAGDDLRRLDWSVYARSEQLMVKLFCEEVDPRCDLIIDHSGSMSAPNLNKAAAALGLGAILAEAARSGGFSLKVWHCREQLELEHNPLSPLEWRDLAFDSAYNPADSITRFAGSFQARGIRILVSDLLWQGEPGRFLRRFTDGAMRGIILEVLLPEEINPLLSGNIMLQDAECGEERELMIDERLLQRYRERLERHRQMWHREAANFGVQLLAVSAAELYPAWNLNELFRSGVLK
ncbi:MAG: DUF58 domain-containing protein, partial [Victivallaceae bacterium]